MRKALLAGAGGLVLVVSGPLMAGRNNVDCTISATPVDFGIYNPISGGPADSTGRVMVLCNGKAKDPVTFSIAMGSVAAGRYNPPRELGAGNGYSLEYELYDSASRTPAAIWGDNTGGSEVVYGSIIIPKHERSGSASFTVYARIFAAQLVAAGQYQDTQAVLVMF